MELKIFAQDKKKEKKKKIGDGGSVFLSFPVDVAFHIFIKCILQNRIYRTILYDGMLISIQEFGESEGSHSPWFNSTPMLCRCLDQIFFVVYFTNSQYSMYVH